MAAAPAVAPYQRADRAAAWDRALVGASLLAIAAVADITIVAWIFPIAQSLAECAGVPYLEAIGVGAMATAAAAPVVVAATVLVWCLPRRTR
jgi:hypothetical protein